MPLITGQEPARSSRRWLYVASLLALLLLGLVALAFIPIFMPVDVTLGRVQTTIHANLYPPDYCGFYVYAGPGYGLLERYDVYDITVLNLHYRIERHFLPAFHRR